MKTQRFGVEIEFTGITRERASRAVVETLNGSARYFGGSYGKYTVTMLDGRFWDIVSDSSIQAVKKDGTNVGGEYRCELVSPICTYSDIETIQEVIRAIRKAGAIVNHSCGIHIHIDMKEHTARSLNNITNILASKETLLFQALQVPQERVNRWCKKVENTLLDRLYAKKPKTLAELKTLWYNGNDGSSQHYHSSRYHALNLHSVWNKGTVEFRMFNSTLHAGKVKSYIQLCLAISHQAKVQKSASRKETITTNPKYTFRTWLLRLALIGDEFKTARLHLLENLEGDIAWKDNRRVRSVA